MSKIPFRCISSLYIKNKLKYNYSSHNFYTQFNVFYSNDYKFNAKQTNTTTNFPNRNYCTKIIDEDNDQSVEHEFDLFEETIENHFYDINITSKNILYPNSTDPLINELNQCINFNEICQKVKLNIDKFQKIHIVQTILIMSETSKDEKLNHDKYSEKELTKETEWILKSIGKFKTEMNPDELSCCLLYMNKIGVPIENEYMREIIQECLERINDDKSSFSSTALSRFTVAVNNARGNLYIYLICKDTIPRLLDKLKNCSTSEELRLLTICLLHIQKLVSNTILKMYKNKVEELYNSGIINSNTIRCNLKIIIFLNYPHWSIQHTKLIRKICLVMKNNINKFQSNDLVMLFKIFQSHLEPAAILPDITSHSKKLLETSSPTPDLLSCSVLYNLPESRVELIKIAKEMVYATNISETTSSDLFKVLRLLKISNINLVNAYWNRIIEAIEVNPKEQEAFRIARYSHRYMYFNNNLGGTYRHYNFEKFISKIILKELENGLTVHIPLRFARLASFIIAYGNADREETTFSNIIKKLKDMNEQFSIIDCLQISRGLKIALELRFRKFIPRDMAPQIAEIEQLLNTCVQRHIDKKDLRLNELNNIFRTFNNKKSSRKTYLFQQIISKYETINDPLNSRTVRDIAFNLNASSFRIPTLCEKVLDYILKNYEYVVGDTVEKVLYCCYNLGYIPKNEKVLEHSVAIIHRDFDYMTGLAIVQACLALSFFKALPESLINRVFNISFIQRLEDEIKLCYSKATYPEKIFNQVMQLNRSVCLDYPEAKIPWFQQNYIEAQLSKESRVETHFFLEVQKLLMSVVPNEKSLIKNFVTPYGYRIDFVLNMDKDHNLISAPKIKDETDLLNVFRIAIILPKIESFCENNIYFFKGKEYLKQRHLEMLGYKVIHINYNEWNSMYMNLPNARLDYLKNLLQIA